MLRTLMGVAWAVMVAGACAPRPAPSSSPSQRDLLSQEEMLQAGYPDTFATVQSLRPQWLLRRGATSLRQGETIKVYLDGTLLGGPDQLRQIMTRSISTIRWMDGLAASERWGLDHGAGAIVVSTRRPAT